MKLRHLIHKLLNPNSDFIAIEIAQGITGTLGIILTVPIGALLCSLLYHKHLKAS